MIFRNRIIIIIIFERLYRFPMSQYAHTHKLNVKSRRSLVRTQFGEDIFVYVNVIVEYISSPKAITLFVPTRGLVLHNIIMLPELQCLDVMRWNEQFNGIFEDAKKDLRTTNQIFYFLIPGIFWWDFQLCHIFQKCVFCATLSLQIMICYRNNTSLPKWRRCENIYTHCQQHTMDDDDDGW